jgi:predicted membrane-bound spermidine synthase
MDIKFSPPRWVFYIFFAISGFSGLIYESIWSHYLKLFLGHAALAQSLVLMIFMGGMALGAWAASRYSESVKSPIMIYVIVESVIGITAFLFHGVFTSVIDLFYNSLLPGLGNPEMGSILKWLAAALLIIPQSFLLGTTFPLMTAGIIRRYPDSPGASISMLYFVNSIGAAAGVLASGFLFIRLWGLPGTIMTAGLINILLALSVWILLRVDVAGVTKPLSSTIQTGEKAYTANLFLLVAGFTGAASFIYEISWIRMLSMVLGSTTHSFELMLSAFITGLALGGFWIRKRIDQIHAPVRFLAVVQISMGIMALLTIPVYLQSFEWMGNFIAALNRSSDQAYALFTAFSHLIALLVMLPATFLAGMTLPLLTHVMIRNGVGEKSIGRVYSANTVGAILGVLFAMHIGLPFLGIKSLIVVGALLDIGLGIFLVRRMIAGTAGVKEYGLIVAACVSLFFVTLVTRVDTSLLTSGVFRSGAEAFKVDREVLFYRDGKTASVGFFITSSGDGTITTNGKPDASIVLDPEKIIRTEDEITMTMAGALPFAYRPDARIIANIGMGSGMTTHTILADDSVELVDTIEIEESMVMGSRCYGELVARAHEDPRSVIHIDDAKSFFAVNNQQYDIIVAEPSNPWVSGVASLFSNEFYASVKNYLDDEGLFVQWIQLYEFNDQLLLSILKALDENFDDYVIYSTDSSNALIVSKKTGQLKRPVWDRLFSSGLGTELKKQHINSQNDLIARRIADKANFQSIFARSAAVANSDYFPFVDLNAGEARFKYSSSVMLEEWSRAPLPMLEMLNHYSVDYSDRTSNPFLRKSEDINQAQFILEVLRGSSLEELSEFPDDKLVQQLSTLRLVSRDCSFEKNHIAWNAASFAGALKVLSYLNAEQAMEFVELLGGRHCPPATRLHIQNSFLDFYSAVGQRDGHAMIDAGMSILAMAPGNRQIQIDYVLSGILLGYLSLGQYEAALNFVGEEISSMASPKFGQFHHQQLLLGTALEER